MVSRSGWAAGRLREGADVRKPVMDMIRAEKDLRRPEVGKMHAEACKLRERVDKFMGGIKNSI